MMNYDRGDYEAGNGSNQIKLYGAMTEEKKIHEKNWLRNANKSAKVRYQNHRT
jgi:hypothetical protein